MASEVWKARPPSTMTTSKPSGRASAPARPSPFGPPRLGCGDELVADAPHRPEEGRVGRVVLDLGPQALDTSVHEAGVAEVRVVPNRLEQQRPREHLPRTASQFEQQSHL